jgi:hypothetical protein
MTYGEIRDASLMLIGQYTIAGTEYLPSYNNQQDYLLKIPFLVNDCLIYIATSVRRLPSHVVLNPEDGEDYGNWRRYVLPDDLLEIRSGGLFIPDADKRCGESSIFTRYKVQDPDHILIPKYVEKPLILDYFRKPTTLPITGGLPADDTVIDAPIDVCMAVPYYVAAHLVQEDDPFRYSSLYNEFENKMARMTPAPYTEIQEVYDVYGGFDGYDGWGEFWYE